MFAEIQHFHALTQSLLEPPPIIITNDVWGANTDPLIVGVGAPGGVDPKSVPEGDLWMDNVPSLIQGPRGIAPGSVDPSSVPEGDLWQDNVPALIQGVGTSGKYDGTVTAPA